MTVNVRSFILSGAGRRPVTKFSDTFVGADRPFFIGNDWAIVPCVDSAVAFSLIAGEINVGATGLIWGDGSAPNNNNTNSHVFATLIDRAATVVKSINSGLFSEMQVVSRPIVGVNAAMGPMVLGNSGSASSYGLQLNSITNTTPLFRHNAGGGYTALVASVFNNAPGDVVRLESRIVGGFPELKSYLNGVLMNTTVDNSGLGPTSGEPGMILYGVFSGQLVVKNVNIGTL